MIYSYHLIECNVLEPGITPYLGEQLLQHLLPPLRLLLPLLLLPLLLLSPPRLSLRQQGSAFFRQSN
jgi:hypothetical protein